MPSYNKQLRTWFFTTVGDSKINNFWTRFVGNGVSKPSEQTMANLTASVPFFKEIDSSASVDIGQALENKQGLVVIAADQNAKDGTNTALAATGGALVVKPSQLPTIEQSVNNFTVTTVPADGISTLSQVVFDIVPDITVTTKNKYLVKLSTPFVKWLLRRVVPVGGTASQVLSKTTGADFDFSWATVAAASGGDTYRGTSTSSVSIIKESKTFTVIPNAGTVAYSIGNRVRFTDTASNLNYLEGIITTWNTVTGQLVLNVDNLGGTGTIANWTVNLGGDIPSSVITGVANLYVSNLGGNDTTGDGSINKPFLTISKAVSVVGSNQTIIIFAGNYSNNINVVKSSAGNTNGSPTGKIKYTIYCFPGVVITQESAVGNGITTVAFYDSWTNDCRVDIVGFPDIICGNFTVVSNPTFNNYAFIVKKVCKLQIGKLTCSQAIFGFTYLYGLNDSSNANESTYINVKEILYSSNNIILPAVRLAGAAAGSSPIRNNAIDLILESVYSITGTTNSNYILIDNAYSVRFSRLFIYHGGSSQLTNPTFIKFMGVTNEVSFVDCGFRLGGSGVSTAIIYDFVSFNQPKTLFKNIIVSLSDCTFFSSTSAVSVIAEDIYMIGASLIKTAGVTLLASTQSDVGGTFTSSPPRIYRLASSLASFKPVLLE